MGVIATIESKKLRAFVAVWAGHQQWHVIQPRTHTRTHARWCRQKCFRRLDFVPSTNMADSSRSSEHIYYSLLKFYCCTDWCPVGRTLSGGGGGEFGFYSRPNFFSHHAFSNRSLLLFSSLLLGTFSFL